MEAVRLRGRVLGWACPSAEVFLFSLTMFFFVFYALFGIWENVGNSEKKEKGAEDENKRKILLFIILDISIFSPDHLSKPNNGGDFFLLNFSFYFSALIS